MVTARNGESFKLIVRWAAPQMTRLATTMSTPKRHDVIASGVDGTLWHYSSKFGQTNRAPWQRLNLPDISGDVTVSLRKPGHIDCFALGRAGKLWHSVFLGTSWGDWRTLPCQEKLEAVAAVMHVPGCQEVFAVTLDGELVHGRSDEHGGWAPFQRIDTEAVEPMGACVDVAVSSRGPGQVDCVVVGRNGGVWCRSHHGGRWSGWQRMPTYVPVSAVAATSRTGSQQIFAVTEYGDLVNCQRGEDGNWGLPQPIELPEPGLCRDVAAAVSGSGLIECLVVGVKPVTHRWQLSGFQS